MSKANSAEPYIRAAGGAGQHGSLLWLLILAFGLVGAAIALSVMRQEAAEPFVLGLLALFSVVGVVALFGVVLGVVRVGDKPRLDVRADLVDSLNEGVLAVDRDGQVHYANAAYYTLTHTEAVVPVSLEQTFAKFPEAAEPVFRLSQAAREGRKWQEEFRVGVSDAGDGGGADLDVKPGVGDGSVTGQHDVAGGGNRDQGRWYRVLVRPLSADIFDRGDDAPDGLTLWRIADVTYERERQENIYQELQAAIDYLDHAPAGFFSTGARGKLRYMNATLAGWLGYDLVQMSDGSLNATDIISGDSASLLTQATASPNDIKTEILDLDLLRRDGTHLPVRLLHQLSFGADAKIHHTRTLVLNRSPGEDVSEDLRAAQVLFSRFFNSAPIAICSVTADGTICRANGSFARLRDGLRHPGAKSLSEMVRQQDQAVLAAILQEVRSRQATILPRDLILAGENELSIRLFMASVDSSDGEEAAIAYLIDTSEQRRLQAQFAQGQKMQAVGQLAGGIAHDFNNVLTAIIGYSDLLLASHRPTDPAFQDIMHIKQNANRAAGLVRQLLAFSRRQTLVPQVLQLTEAMGDLSVMLGRLIGEKIDLSVNHGQDLWLVEADLIQLEQVIVNLVVNARDAMPDGGRLTIGTANISRKRAAAYNYQGFIEGEYVLIEIADNGTGMAPEVLEKIFEPFFTTKEVGRGTGLGLSTVYGIIKQTGGFIYPHSELGKGTTFRIFLPRHVPSADGPVAETEETQRVRARDLTGHGTVLLVEDEDAVRAFSARALSSRGYTVLEAPSGVAALEVIAAHDGEIDLVVSDVVMPEMDGPTLLKELRKTHEDIKIIFISGYAEDAFNRSLEGDEQFTFLPKPFNLKQLAAKVKEVLEG